MKTRETNIKTLYITLYPEVFNQFKLYTVFQEHNKHSATPKEMKNIFNSITEWEIKNDIQEAYREYEELTAKCLEVLEYFQTTNLGGYDFIELESK